MFSFLSSVSISLHFISSPQVLVTTFKQAGAAQRTFYNPGAFTQNSMRAVQPGVRRSMRLRGITADVNDEPSRQSAKKRKIAKASVRTSKPTLANETKKHAPEHKSKSKRTKSIQDPLSCLARTREEELISAQQSQSNLQIIGVDEAGRGPLAGPVVAAAAIIPTNIPGITDSKKITKEQMREELYEKIVSTPNARWAVAISDSKRIDEINILQATLESMRKAVQSIIEIPHVRPEVEVEKACNTNDRPLQSNWREIKASSNLEGCYVVCGINDSQGKPIKLTPGIVKNEVGNREYTYHALVDGNRLPKYMPCEAEPMVKGDSREYAIAAASILAKVTRDRLMHEYDIMFPAYGLKGHKGYPTAKHMSKVKEIGASPIHRRTFAPLKHMTFDKDGNII